jgi:N-acetylmuramoyl-L-alanine amidase
MPAALVEVGYINHDVDRAKLLSSEFQSAVAGAIVKGVKVYIGDVKTKEQAN